MRARTKLAVLALGMTLLTGATQPAARAIIVLNPDETECLAPPANGAPWNYVARLENRFGPRATGVYLGNRYLLTANHVDEDINVVHLNGVNYARDESFKPIVLSGTDLRVMRITNDPGLPALPLIAPAESELGKPCTMIGYGAGKGAPIPSQGWMWGDDSTRLKRWATSTTLPAYRIDPQSHFSYIPTTFDPNAGPRTGQIAIADSGCGLFENLAGVWKLVGIGEDVETDGKALYNRDPAAAVNQPDHSFFLPIRQVVGQIKQAMGE